MICAEKRLKKMEESGKIPHALLFIGSQSLKLQELAYKFASNMILKEGAHAQKKLEGRSHPDIHFFHPEGRTGMHGVESLRRLGTEVAMHCYEAKQKFVIMVEAERCLPTSSNALLKTLEEPRSDTVMILISAKPEKLLPTIISRCQRLIFEKEKTVLNVYQRRLLECLAGDAKGLESIALDLEKERKEWEKKMMGELPKDLPLLQREKMEKEIEGVGAVEFQEKAFSLFETFLLWWRDVNFLRLGVPVQHLIFSDHIEALQKYKKASYEEVEKMVLQMKMGLERGSSLHHVLEALFIRFSEPSAS